MRGAAALAVACVLAGEAAAAGGTTHDLSVTIDPTTSMLTAADRIELPASSDRDAIVFLLHENLVPRAAAASVTQREKPLDFRYAMRYLVGR